MVLARGGGSFQYYVDATITETHLVERRRAGDRGAPLPGKLGDALTSHRRCGGSGGRRRRRKSSPIGSPSSRAVIVAAPPLLRRPHRIRSGAPRGPRAAAAPHGERIGIRGITIYDEPFGARMGSAA